MITGRKKRSIDRRLRLKLKTYIYVRNLILVPPILSQYPIKLPPLKWWMNQQLEEAGQQSSASSGRRCPSQHEMVLHFKLYEVVPTEIEDRASSGSESLCISRPFYIMRPMWLGGPSFAGRGTSVNVYGMFVECGGVSGKWISRFGAASEQPPTQALVKRFLRKFQLEIHYWEPGTKHL